MTLKGSLDMNWDTAKFQDKYTTWTAHSAFDGYEPSVECLK